MKRRQRSISQYLMAKLGEEMTLFGWTMTRMDFCKYIYFIMVSISIYADHITTILTIVEFYQQEQYWFGSLCVLSYFLSTLFRAYAFLPQLWTRRKNEGQSWTKLKYNSLLYTWPFTLHDLIWANAVPTTIITLYSQLFVKRVSGLVLAASATSVITLARSVNDGFKDLYTNFEIDSTHYDDFLLTGLTYVIELVQTLIEILSKMLLLVAFSFASRPNGVWIYFTIVSFFCVLIVISGDEHVKYYLNEVIRQFKGKKQVAMLRPLRTTMTVLRKKTSSDMKKNKFKGIGLLLKRVAMLLGSILLVLIYIVMLICIFVFRLAVTALGIAIYHKPMYFYHALTNYYTTDYYKMFSHPRYKQSLYWSRSAQIVTLLTIIALSGYFYPDLDTKYSKSVFWLGLACTVIILPIYIMDIFLLIRKRGKVLRKMEIICKSLGYETDYSKIDKVEQEKILLCYDKLGQVKLKNLKKIIQREENSSKLNKFGLEKYRLALFIMGQTLSSRHIEEFKKKYIQRYIKEVSSALVRLAPSYENEIITEEFNVVLKHFPTELSDVYMECKTDLSDIVHTEFNYQVYLEYLHTIKRISTSSKLEECLSSFEKILRYEKIFASILSDLVGFEYKNELLSYLHEEILQFSYNLKSVDDSTLVAISSTFTKDVYVRTIFVIFQIIPFYNAEGIIKKFQQKLIDHCSLIDFTEEHVRSMIESYDALLQKEIRASKSKARARSPRNSQKGKKKNSFIKSEIQTMTSSLMKPIKPNHPPFYLDTQSQDYASLQAISPITKDDPQRQFFTNQDIEKYRIEIHKIENDEKSIEDEEVIESSINKNDTEIIPLEISGFNKSQLSHCVNVHSKSQMDLEESKVLNLAELKTEEEERVEVVKLTFSVNDTEIEEEDGVNKERSK